MQKELNQLIKIFSSEKAEKAIIQNIDHKEFHKALEVDPENYEAIFGLAMTYKESNQVEAAIRGFECLLDLDSKDTKPYINLADIYQGIGKNEIALEMIKEAVQAEKEIKFALSMERSQPLLNAHFNSALLHEARGEIELAIGEYRKEQEICPYNYRPDFNLGLLFSRKKIWLRRKKNLEAAWKRTINIHQLISSWPKQLWTEEETFLKLKNLPLLSLILIQICQLRFWGISF